MKFLILLLVIFVFTKKQGTLVLNGGGEKPDSVMNEFIRVSGGRNAPIIFSTLASGESDAPEYYYKLFRETYRCTNVTFLNITKRDDSFLPKWVQLVESAGGLWFSGGDQIKITNALLSTPVGNALQKSFFEKGLSVGGTSAGTACQSELMMTGKGNLKVIKRRNIELVRGLGLWKGVILDQHFVERQRQNRLISSLLENRRFHGVGVGEDTAAVYRNDNTFDVFGDGWVIVYDTSNVRVNSGRGDNIGGWDLRIHVLQPGESFNMTSMRPFRK